VVEASRHQQLEQRFRELLCCADLPDPDEVAHLRRSVLFVWHESKSLVLVDLDELSEQEDPLEGINAVELASILGLSPLSIDLSAAGAAQQNPIETA
jgi:hypothetical protein